MSAPAGATPAAVERPSLHFMLRHPSHMLALGFGSGLSPRAPGTAGTLWAWAAFLLLEHGFGPLPWPALLALGLAVGVWACTRCAQNLGMADPGAIVWDEVLAFWAVLWWVAPHGLVAQLLAFGLFRYFDAAKPWPVGWADRLFKRPPGGTIGWAQGFGILFDDLVAAACTLAVMAAVGWLWT